MDYDELNARLAERKPNSLLFLPYLVGTNAPEFDESATGVFWGLRQEHDSVDMAAAVMEGVSFVLRKNCEHMAGNGLKPTAIIATGGGAKSAYWCQLQADITGLPVEVPAVTEAGCLGAAMIAAWNAGQYESLEAAAKDVKMVRRYEPKPSDLIEKKYARFCKLYKAAIEIAKM
jgi:xylulokinase